MRACRISLFSAFLFAAIAGLARLPACAEASPQASTMASSVVKPQVYVSLNPVPRGKEFQIAVVVDIARGFHVNSHKPSEDYLISTTLTPQLPPGFQLADTIYPNGRLEKFSFSPNKPLDVYTESVTLKMKLLAQANAPLGPTTIPVTLRYQACNDASCLPPVKVPVSVRLDVAAAGTKAQLSHPEIFLAPPPKQLIH
jgi:thiol:disulfide interchange protein DsbD